MGARTVVQVDSRALVSSGTTMPRPPMLSRYWHMPSCKSTTRALACGNRGRDSCSKSLHCTWKPWARNDGTMKFAQALAENWRSLATMHHIVTDIITILSHAVAQSYGIRADPSVFVQTLRFRIFRGATKCYTKCGKTCADLPILAHVSSSNAGAGLRNL